MTAQLQDVAMQNTRAVADRVISVAVLFALPRSATAEPVVFDGGGISFFGILLVFCGSLAWWRHTAGDKLAAVTVWAAMLAVAGMVIRYGPNDTLRFFASMVGA